jgi:hypothetical protein
MKSLLTTILTFMFVLSVSGQEVKQQVVASAGGFEVSGDNSISLSWTLGELVITTVESESGDMILTQGFQQSVLVINAIQKNPDLGVEVIVFPNPTSDLININFSAPLDGETELFLNSATGRLVYSNKMMLGELLKQINMHQYPGGTYILRIQNGIRINIYKIIKL